jgi:hypothetical protein
METCPKLGLINMYISQNETQTFKYSYIPAAFNIYDFTV